MLLRIGNTIVDANQIKFMKLDATANVMHVLFKDGSTLIEEDFTVNKYQELYKKLDHYYGTTFNSITQQTNQSAQPKK